MPAPSARQRLLEAADELFHEGSIRAVGIDEIVTRAGVAKMSLYNHFRSKDELIAAYLQARDERVTPQIIADAQRRGRTPDRRILAYFDVVADRIGPGYRGCPFLNAMAELGTTHPAHRAVLAHKERVRRYFEENLRAARRPRARATSEALLILLNGALSTAALRNSNRPVRDARRIVETLLATPRR